MSHQVGKHLRNHAVGYLALFVALGGVSYAAVALPKNSVGPKQLKKGAVTRAKIANSAVNGAKVAPNSLTGADIRSSTLGQVPSATFAGSAGSANTANTATNAGHANTANTSTNAGHARTADTAARAGDANLLGGSTAADFFPASKVRTFNVKLAFGQTQTLFSAGTLTFSAACVQNQTDPNGVPNRDFVEVIVATSQNGGILTNGSGGGLTGGAGASLDTDTPEAERVLAYVAGNTTVPFGTIENNASGWGMQAVDPNGIAVIFPDGLTGAVNLFGSNCYLAGFAIIP
jgi:hypothetical protein